MAFFEITAVVIGIMFAFAAIMANLYCPMEQSWKGALFGSGFILVLAFIFTVVGGVSFLEGGFLTIFGAFLRAFVGYKGFQAIREKDLKKIGKYIRNLQILVPIVVIFDILSLWMYLELFGVSKELDWNRTTEDTFIVVGIIGIASDIMGVCWSAVCAKTLETEIKKADAWLIA